MRAAAFRCWLVVLLSLGSWACGPSASRPSAGTSAQSEEPAHPDDPVVTLVSPGEEPRSPLRYQFTAGQRSTMAIDMTLTIALAMGASPKKVVATPPLRMILELDVVEVSSPAGTALVRSTVQGVEVLAGSSVAPELVDAVRSETRELVGVTTESRITRRGFARSVESALPESVSPKLRATLENFRSASQEVVAPFPVEPVGIGAHWRVDSTATTPMLSFRQRTLVTLIERDERRVVLSYTIDQVAPPQKLHLPEMPPGATGMLESYRGHGNGRSEAPLDARSPTAEMSVRSNLVSAVTVGQERVSLTNEMEMLMKIAPAAPASLPP